MLRKVINLMIVLLLVCLNNLPLQAQTKDNVISSTGKVLHSDTSKVIIPISYLREANAKLIERVYLIKINAEKDSIINLNNQYSFQQNGIIKDFQLRMVGLTNDNNKLKNTITKQKNKNKVLGSVAGISIILTIISFLK